ncbi:MAG: PKD domain-containing protein [Candidatus Thermoplasmatota archaeon]|jgi:hypothetical protein|nr:PKD domain-containing protein [Candidatus Thermoplasmatota archaeon]
MIMLLDGADQPHIIYGTDIGLTHAMFDGFSWTREHIPGTTNMTWDVSATLDDDGQPHIAHFSYGLGLNHTWKDEEEWHSVTVDQEYQSMPSIGVGSNGLVHIAYRVGNQLRYAECNGTAVQRVSPGTGNFYGISLAIDSTDRVCISASNRSIPSYGKLEYFQRTPFGWGRSTIPEGEGAFSYTVLRFDRSDRPFICYTVRTTKDRLDMVYLNGAAWSHSTTDDEMNRVLFDFQLGLNDAPNIITDDNHGQWSGTKWVFTDIDLPGLRWSSQCMDIDPLGNVHLAVFVEDNDKVMVAHAIYGFDIERPVADAGDDRDIEFGDTLVLDGSRSSDDTDISRWLWTIRVGDLILKREGVKVELDTFMMGPHNITLRAVDTSGNFDDDTALVMAKDMTPPLVKAGDDITVDQHTLVQFNGSRSTDLTFDLNYTWIIGYVSTIKLYGPVQTFTFHEAGSFEVLLLVNDSSGNIGQDMMMVTVLDTTSPRTIGLNDRLVPQYSSIYLDASGCTDNIGIDDFNWSIQRHRSTWYLEGVNVSLFLDEAGEYDVVLTIMDASGNRNLTSFTVFSLDREPPVAMFDCPQSIRSGDILELDGGLSTDNIGVLEWSWSTTDGTDIVESKSRIASFTFMAPGNHTITLTVKDREGNSGSTTRYTNVFVLESPDGDGDRNGIASWTLPVIIFMMLLLVLVVLTLLVRWYRRRDEMANNTEAETTPSEPSTKVPERTVPRERGTKIARTSLQAPSDTFVADGHGPEPFDGPSGTLDDGAAIEE